MTTGIACGLASLPENLPNLVVAGGVSVNAGERKQKGGLDKEDEIGAVDSEGFGRGAAPAWLAAVVADANLLFEVGCGGVLILLRCLIKYLSTWFIMDVASTIPFEGLGYLITGEVKSGLSYSLLGMLRLWRLRKQAILH